MDQPRVRDAHRELVEVWARVESGHADRGERRLQLGRAGRPERRHVAQPVRTDGGQVDRGGQREERLVGADVAGRLVAPDVLLAGAHGHDERAPAVEVGGHPDQPAGDLPDERVGRGQDPEIRSAVLRRDAQRLPLAGGDIGSVRTGRGQDGEADRLDDRDEERAGGMRQPADLGHRLEQAEEIRLRGDDPGDGTVGLGQHPFERGEVGRAGRRPVRDERDLVELEPALEVRPRGLPVVRMDPARDEDPVAPGRADGHQRRLGGGCRAVVVRGRHDVEVDQLGQQRFVLVDALEGPLADLGLVGRIGRVPLAAQEQLVDRRWRPVAVDAGAQERGEVGPIAGGQPGQARRELELGLRLGQVEPRSAELDRDVLEELVDRGQAEGREHPLTVVGGMGTVGHRVGQPAAISAS